MTDTVPVGAPDLPEVDLLGAEYQREPSLVLRRAREVSWIVRTVRGYEVISYDAAQALSVDRGLDSVGPEYYERLGASEEIMWYATQASLPMIEGARHERIRKALQHGFTRRHIDDLRPRMRAVAARLIDRMAGCDPVDLVSGFTHHYPIEVLCALMGIPAQDIPTFSAWTVDLGLLAQYPLEPHMPRIDAAIRGLREYFTGLVAERRTQPGDDFVTSVIEAQRETGALTIDELCGALLNLLFAGHDTTRFQFGWVVRLLIEAGQWERLGAAPELVPRAVEEAMRLEPSLHVLLRKAVTDIEYGGVTIQAGTLLILNTFAANRDPATFPDPDRFDLDRPNANRHLTFGRGGHMCLGHALARAEMSEALDLFLRRFPSLRLAETPQPPDELSAMSGAERILLTHRTAP